MTKSLALLGLVLLSFASTSCRRKVPIDHDGGLPDSQPTAVTTPPPSPSIAPPCLIAPGSFAEIASRLAPNIVTITSTADTAGGSSSGPSSALPLPWPISTPVTSPVGERRPVLGTGFLLGADSTVITSHRLLHRLSPLLVRLHDGQERSATLRGTDPDLDLAVLTLEEPVADAVVVHDSSRLAPGDWVAVLSNPFGSETTVTAGVVRFTALSGDDQPTPHGGQRTFLGVDATIDAANWGGLVTDTGGRLVGLAVSAPRTGSDVGMVLPAEPLRRSVNQLSQHGHPGRTWIGLWVRELEDDQAIALGIDPPRGLLVTRVAPTGPAQEAGIESDDIILELSGVSVGSPSELGAVAARVEPGESTPMLVLRDGRPRTLRLRPALMPQ